MSINYSYYSGSTAGLPPREFLKALPVRLSYLVFDTETDDKNNPQTTLKELEEKLFKEKKHLSNRPLYFIMDENADGLTPIDTTDYLTKSLLDVLPSGSGWAVRWERHSSFVTITFFRYFAATSTSLGGKTALDCLHQEMISPDDLQKETLHGGNINVAVIPHAWNLDAALHEMGLRIHNNPFLTGSMVFDGVAKVWMSFEVEEKNKPRPIVIRGTSDMNECVAGELIQVLLEIETYRLVASCRTSDDELRKAIDKLKEHEDQFKKNAIRIEAYLKEKRTLLQDLITVEDYLPVLRNLATISTAIETEIAEGATKYIAAKAFRDLVISRLHDLHEKQIDHNPTINQFLRHRLEQVNHTCASILQGQEGLSQHISRLDGLLRTRMEARQQYSMHCVHFLILALTVFSVLYYSSGFFEHNFNLDGKIAAGGSLIAILTVGIFLFMKKFNIRKKAYGDIGKELTGSKNERGHS